MSCRIAQVDHQCPFGKWDSDHPCAPTAPTGRKGLDLSLAHRTERVANVEIGWAGSHEAESFGLQIFLNAGINPLSD